MSSLPSATRVPRPCQRRLIGDPTSCRSVGTTPKRGQRHGTMDIAARKAAEEKPTGPMSTRDPLGWLKRRMIVNYVVPVLSVGATLIVARWLDLYLQAAPVSLFICAVMFSAWFGGFMPGLLATVLSVLAFQYYFVPPIYSFAVEPAEIPRAVVFALAAFFVGSLSAGQRRATEALRESEQRFRDYAETASDWLWETGPDHRITRISEHIDAVGIAPSRIPGVARWDIATDIESEPEKWRRHREMLDAHQAFRDFVYSTVNESGSPVYVRTSGKPVFGAKGNFLGYRGTGADITAIIRADHAEEALRKAQMELAHVTRVTTLGELTASIAHEVNQPLAAIVANAEACLRWLDHEIPDLGAARRSVEWVIDDGNRASEVIRRVRALANKTDIEKVALDVNNVIREVIALVQHELISHQVSLRMELAPALPVIPGDRVQLQQVVINLMINGVEAMQSVTDRPRELVIRSSQDEAQQVLVSVADCGVGISAENADRLFNAFFTTKASGMGMGLSICRSIIEAHGGRLWATANVP